VGRQTLWVFETKIPGVLEFGPLVLFLAPDAADSRVEELQDMELVEGQPGHTDVILQHAPQPGVMLPDQLGDPLDRHRLSRDHDVGLKQKRKAAAGTRPRHGYLKDHAPATPDPRHPGNQMGFVLKEVQMPLALRLRVVQRAVCLSTAGTGKSAPPGEVQTDVQTSFLGIELTTHHLPRWGQP